MANGIIASVSDVPIKGAPSANKIPTSYSFSKVKLTIDVPINDQDGAFHSMDSVSIDLEDSNLVLDKDIRSKIEEVSTLVYKLQDKIN